MLVNVVDVPPLCNFIMPAIARVGPISIAVSTRGASPALAKRLRSEIAERYGEPYAQLAEMLNDDPRLGARHAADLPGSQALLRGHRARPARSDRAPARAATRRPCATSSPRTCAPPRAPVPLPERWVRGGFIERVAERSFGAAFPMFREADPALERADGAGAAGAPTRRPTWTRAPAARRCCSWARRWATRAGASRASPSRPSARCSAGARPTRPRACGPRAGPSSRARSSTARSTTLGLEAETVLWNVVPAHPHRPGRAALEPHAGGRRAARGRRGAGRADRAPRAARDRRRRPQRGARARRARPALRRERAPSGQRRRDGVPRGARARYVAVGALMVARVADRRAQRQRAQHQHERDAADQRVRDHDRGLRADRERQQLAVAGRAAEHDDDQRLLRADAARRDRQQRRERSDDHHEQRVAQRAGDAERLEEGGRGADAADPAGQLRHGHRDRIAARRAEDREALAHACGEAPCRRCGGAAR